MLLPPFLSLAFRNTSRIFLRTSSLVDVGWALAIHSENLYNYKTKHKLLTRNTLTEIVFVKTLLRRENQAKSYLRFPMKYKIGLLRTLAHRASKICSSDSLDAEIKFLKRML